jgi:hypothetical protein
VFFPFFSSNYFLFLFFSLSSPLLILFLQDKRRDRWCCVRDTNTEQIGSGTFSLTN